IITGKFLAFALRLHDDLATRVQRARQMTSASPSGKRLPDGPEPQGLRGPPGKSLNCSLNLIRLGAAFTSHIEGHFKSDRIRTKDFFGPDAGWSAFTFHHRAISFYR